MDNIPGPSRQAPLPYDDPYEDTHPPLELPNSTEDRRSVSSNITNRTELHGYRGRGRGRTRERGRGRGRGRDREDRNNQIRHNRNFAGQNRYNQDPNLPFNQQYNQNEISADYHGYTPNLSQTYPSGGTANNIYSNMSALPTRGYDQSQQSFVQPHINPRFASMLGMNMNNTNFQQHLSQQSYAGFSPQLAFGNSPWSGNNSSTGGEFNMNQHYFISTDSEDSTRNLDEYHP